MDCWITENWDDLLNHIPSENRDVYFEEGYVRLYEDRDHSAMCIVVSDDGKLLLMPYIRGNAYGHFDFETPYGYGGPLTNTNDLKWIHEAFTAIHEYMCDENYLCGLIRFHPLLENVRLYNNYNSPVQVLYDRKTVVIDTCKGEDDIWNNQISSKNRNMIRKAEKNNLEYKREDGFDSLDEFLHLYIGTMRRLGADDFFFFDTSYFKKFVRNFLGKAFLGTIRKDGKLICGGIFMYSAHYGHYHLQGNNRDYSSLGAGNYLLWKVACDMSKMGIDMFHLGGGTSALEDDSLYKFKKTFSRNVNSFFIGKEIFNSSAYYSICEDWKEENAELADRYGSYLLRYRYTKENCGNRR